jgi:uracil-DNA glycosylase family 4
MANAGAQDRPLPGGSTRLDELARRVVTCTRCPRLVAWREEAAANPPRRYAGERYWARPLPGFGDRNARLVVIGLAPGAHGANRTGRMFSGDRSGEWLYGAMHRVGFATRPTSRGRGDELRLDRAYITAVVRCAPPGNRPLPGERDNCVPYLVEELPLLPQARVLLALGAFAWDGALLTARALGHEVPRPKPRFAHGAEIELGPYVLLGSYHVSQQNTFTGKLTREMLDAIFARARALAGPG